MYTQNNPSNFTKSEIAAALQIWNRAAVSLLDIRHNLIAPKEAIYNYSLPSSTFLYTNGGHTEVFLNDTRYDVNRIGLFHAGKGTELTLIPQCDWVEYYMVLYKSGEPPFHRREFIKRMEKVNPFQQHYGFAPKNPIFISELLRKMYEKWKGPTALSLFYGKSAFYQLVYAVYEELEGGFVDIFEPDSVAMAMRYLNEHYGEELSMQELCGILGVSYSHFYKRFKERTGVSPQEYLIQTRLSAAKHWLEDSAMPMRAIADSTGFANERNFYRTFAKHYGISPNTFRKNASVEKNDYVIGKARPFPYNLESRVSNDELKGKGATFMFKQMRSKAVMAAALSLMLLMSACGTAPAETGGVTSTPTAVITAQTPEEAGTRIVSTMMGDVEVPANPKRVVVQYLMGDVAALGITPVGISDVYDGAAFAELVSDSTSLGWMPDWEAESVMALEPDLILVSGEDAVAEFSKIAPTIYVPYGEMTQEERVTFMGELLNRQEEAAAAIELYNTTLSDAKANLSAAGFGDYSVSVFEGGADASMGVHGNKYGAGGTVYVSLGLRAPEAVQTNIIDRDSYSEKVSFEVLANYTGDFIIRNAYEGMADLTEDAIWNSLKAVQKERVIELEFGFNYYTDIYSATAQIQYISDALVAAAN